MGTRHQFDYFISYYTRKYKLNLGDNVYELLFEYLPIQEIEDDDDSDSELSSRCYSG